MSGVCVFRGTLKGSDESEQRNKKKHHCNMDSNNASHD